jgi:hypothetical protein
MRTFANHRLAFLLVAVALVLKNNALAEETGTKSVCDTKILGRPGCEVGDFYIVRDRQTQMMDFLRIRADREIRLITSPQLLTPEELLNKVIRLRQPQDGVLELIKVQELINRVRAVFPLDSRSSESEQLGPIRDIREAPMNYGRGQGCQITPDSQLNHQAGQSTKPLHQSGGSIDDESHKK